MTSSLDIEPATLEDEPDIVPLMAAFNAHEHITWRPETMTPALRELLQRPELGLMLLARSGDSRACVGYALATFGYDIEFSGHDAFITELFIDSSSRSRGIGQALLEAAVEALRARGVRAVHLMVRPENAKARALYEKHGFSLVPRLLMTKPLSDEG